MSARRVLLALAGLLLALSPVLVLRVFQEIEILKVADRYRPAEFVVERGHCTQGSAYRGTRPGSGIRYEAARCFLEGSVEGAAERFAVGPESVEEYAAGSTIPIYYAPALEPFGTSSQNLRIQWGTGDPPREVARRQLRLWPLGFGFILAYLIALELLYVWTPGWARARAGPRSWIAPAAGAAPAFGFAFGAFGALLVQSDLRAEEPQGLWIAGLVLFGIGLPFFVRSMVEIDAEAGSLRRRFGFGPIQFRGAPRPLPGEPSVEVVAADSNEALPGLTLRGKGESVELMRSDDSAQLRRLAPQLAELLECPSLDRLAEAEQRRAEKQNAEPLRLGPRPSRLPAVLQTIALAALPLLLIASVPALHRPLLVQLLSREVPQVAALQRLAAAGLAGSDEPAILKRVLLAANTLEGPAQQAALQSIEATAGLVPSAGAPAAERMRRANRWVSEQLDQPTDAYGGVLAWYLVAETWRDEIEEMASPDPRDAWVFWSGFGPADFADSRAFLRAVGPALSDARPLSFAIKRGSFLGDPGPDAPPFEGQPESLDAHRSQALVKTVGGALALRYWIFADVGGEGFPEDFSAWWAGHAREHLLPPLPE